ncbi:hypothetical protein FB639_004096, partial [Coemansia asiatica]
VQAAVCEGSNAASLAIGRSFSRRDCHNLDNCSNPAEGEHSGSDPGRTSSFCNTPVHCAGEGQ